MGQVSWKGLFSNCYVTGRVLFGGGFVVMLAGMDEDRLDLRMALHLADERGDLGEIGTGAYDVDDFQPGAHELVKCFKGPQYSI
jgi:hypothetical protein